MTAFSSSERSPTISHSSSKDLKAKRKPPAVKKPLPPRQASGRLLQHEHARPVLLRGQGRAHRGIAAAHHDHVVLDHSSTVPPQIGRRRRSNAVSTLLLPAAFAPAIRPKTAPDMSPLPPG